jgi:hypothetical protein
MGLGFGSGKSVDESGIRPLPLDSLGLATPAASTEWGKRDSSGGNVAAEVP